jgi:glutamate decarboxylase
MGDFLLIDENLFYAMIVSNKRSCVAMLSHLWHALTPEKAIGCSTTGSSEACMLGGLALNRRWQNQRKHAGKPADRPNIVMGINVQICWDKFTNYWDIEPRLVPMEGNRFHLSAEEAVTLCDENTIGVVGILGSTFDGSYEPIKELAAALDDLQERTGLNIPIHVDAASAMTWLISCLKISNAASFVCKNSRCLCMIQRPQSVLTMVGGAS